MSAPFALVDVTVVTGDREGTLRDSQTIVVDGGGRIQRVGPTDQVTVPPGCRRIDLPGRYVMPGLINAHAHLFADGKPLPPILTSEKAERVVSAFMHGPLGGRMLRRRTRTNVMTQLASGVTTIRSLGDVRYEVVAVRDRIAAGAEPGPRVIASGPLLAISGGHGAPTIALISDDPWAARRNVRLNLRHGVDAIKIAATGGVTDARALGEAGRPQMTEEEMRAICEEAHNAGVLVAAHAQSVEGIKRALRAGVDTIEHGSDLDDEALALFAENPLSLHGSSALVPTLMAALPIVRLDPSITGVGEIVRANGEMILDGMIRGMRAARDAGVTIGMGTDSALTYVTHYNTWREIDFAIRYGGHTPAMALHAATQANARLLGLAGETGAIEEGLAADLLVVDDDPLTDVRTLSHPRLVSARGALIEHPQITRFDEIDRHLDTL